MNEKYWNKFYKQKKVPTVPSDFAKFVAKIFTEDNTFADLGCGNGRDTFHLSKKYDIIGIDNAILPTNKGKAHFFKSDIEGLMKIIHSPDVVYSRFFVHSIPEMTLDKILGWTEKYFVAEFRVLGDEPKLYKKHDRTYYDSNYFIQKLIDHQFDVLFIHKGRSMAKYKNEDPLVMRVIAKKI